LGDPKEADRQESLRARWHEHLAGYPSPKLDAIFDEIVSRHSEPHRAYHNLQHVEQVLDVVDYLARFAVDLRSVRLAAWFHDIVYDPRGPDNEAASALLSRELLAEIGYMSKSAVEAMIFATREHDLDGADFDTMILIDADLAILGSPPETYAAYSAAIRKEYFWVPEARYYSGRSQVLERLLGRKSIYGLPLMRDQFEERARENMKAELESLR
jgi:predicted metal-dependent HD superfamily phosphohydrolase